MSYLLVSLLIWVATCAQSEAAGNNKVLALLENLAVRETHSIFFGQLLEQGFHVDYKVADDPTLAIKKYGEYLYDNLVIFAPSVEEFGGGLSSEAIVEFIDDGGNVLMAGGSNTGEALKDIASDCGFEADEEGTFVIDHMNFDTKDEGHHTLVVAEAANLVASPYIIGSSQSPILYRGVGLVTDSSNPLVIDILSGSSTSYSHNPLDPITSYPHATGLNTLLIAGLQARNNARVVFSGSLELFSDNFISALVERSTGGAAEQSGNAELARSLSAWCFHQTGVIRVDKTEHSLLGADSAPEYYTVKEECVYSVTMSELVKGEWVPFMGQDVQMEFVRIDPFTRQMMVNSAGKLTARFIIPDVYGVFQFKVNHNRLGLTRVATNTQVSVHPLKHDMYERFIVSAYPYYASAFSMMGGVLIFSIIFLHHKELETVKRKEE
eukprot:GFUD01011028.1.p1 GENE.GFUD01011028.1~~GFUD01011028.1.p1  ORF type:complete len:461 (+),score=118.70 GFUD01011028.1:75-1385(+)